MVVRAFLLAIFSAPSAAAQPTNGIAFPPVGTSVQRAFTADALERLDLCHIRIAQAGERRGLVPDDAAFAPLVARLRALEQAGLEVLLTVEWRAPDAVYSVTNRFACMIRDDAPFEASIRALVRLASPHIDAIQIGHQRDNCLPGTSAELRGIHALCDMGADRGIPGFDLRDMRQQVCVEDAGRNADVQGAIATVLATADYDVADIYLHDAPGAWAGAVAWMASHTNAPLLATEFARPSPEVEPTDPAYQAERSRAYLAAIEALPIARSFYFKRTDDPRTYQAPSELYDVTGAAVPAWTVFPSD